MPLHAIDHQGLLLAIIQARKAHTHNGIPIGAALILPDSTEPEGFRVLGAGHNERIQKSSATLHAEMAALESAGRLTGDVYRRSTMYTTLSPCSMCSGAILLYQIPRVVIGENRTFVGEEDLLRSRGVEVIVVDDKECRELMQDFISKHPEEWNEDIGRQGAEGVYTVLRDHDMKFNEY
ncbi:cytidine deaminase-like protein [Crassisporium funariophilum]|nr:cytidine deaminase-like protein [Crassisporium funariophilum]